MVRVMEQSQYLTGEALIWRECPVADYTEIVEGNSHANLVKAFHSHLDVHDWNEKRQYL